MPLFTKSKSAAEVAAPPASKLETSGDPAFERRIQQIGADFLEDTRRHRTGVLSTAFWSQKLIDWAMKDEAFKVQLFRFVDAFPTLRTPEQIHDHLADYLAQPGVTPPSGMGLGLKAGGLLKGAFAKTVSGQITSMAERFIAGTDAASALPMLEKLWSKGIAFSVDLLGEACVSNAEAEVYQRKYLDLVTTLPRHTANWPANERLETDHLGPVPRTNVSIKISSLFARTDPVDFEGSIAGLMEALRPVLETAQEHNVLINFDMEFFEFKDLTLELFMRCCEAVEFPAGLAMQAYLRSGDDDAR
ncbi:MAG: proline dehydrogenase family protein, partial [Planctomycetota bacterium]